jgi:thiol-disulfide isomerase/thioredoxin
MRAPMKRLGPIVQARHARMLARHAWSVVAATLLLAWASPAGAEPLQLVDMDGGRHDADALIAAGHPVVLIFWQTWCTSCKREAPELAQAVKDHGAALRFFGVVSGPDHVIDDEKVQRVAREWEHPQPQIRDRDLALTKRFRVFGTPVVIVLGTGRRELYRGFRLPDDWSVFVATPPAAPGREAS